MAGTIPVLLGRTDGDARWGGSRAAFPAIQVTDCSYGGGYLTALTAVGTGEALYTVGMDCSDIQLVFANFFKSNAPVTDNLPANSVTFSASIRVVSTGTIYRVTQQGNTTVTLAGPSPLIFDPLALDLAAGDKIAVRVYVSAGTYYLNRATSSQAANNGGFVATTDLTAPGSAAITATTSNIFQPVAILGRTKNSDRIKSMVVQGNSQELGVQDGNYPSYAGYFPAKPWVAGGGYIERAMSGIAGVLNLSSGGDRIDQNLTPSGHIYRELLTGAARTSWMGNPYNDFDNGQTAAQAQANIITKALQNHRRGIQRNIIPTCTPKTTSSDNWATAGGQTKSSWDAIRVAHNNWVRAGCPIASAANPTPVAVGTAGALLAGQYGHPIYGYVEVADTVETARDSGLWLPATKVLTDLTSTAGGSAPTSASANFDSSYVGLDILINTANTGSTPLTTHIDTVTNATTITIIGNTPVAGSPYTNTVIGAMTGDGIHMGTRGNALVAAAIKPQIQALLAAI